MSIRTFIEKIKRRETPFYDRLYLILKSAMVVDIPVFRPLGKFLYLERAIRLTCWQWVVQNLYYIPLFKSQCQTYGRNLRIYCGIPQIWGDVRLHIGDNCVMHGTTTLVGAKVFDAPTLRIGNNVYLGSSLTISVGADITIGNDVLIGDGINIFSYESHPANPKDRHGTPTKENGKPVVIEDNVQIGSKTTIMKGVTIGKNSVIANSSFIIKKVPPDSLVMGNPARVFPLFY